MKNSILKGSIFIALGASSYGTLAVFVKMAYREGFSTAEVTLSQYGLGFAVLFILTLLSKRQPELQVNASAVKGIVKLIAAGTSLGLTSVFYYKAVQYIPVSIGIVLLMQTVWMGVVLEMILHKKAPGVRKIIAVFIILAGTLLTTNVLQHTSDINWIGFGWGMMAALTFTATMYSSNHLELQFTPLRRSLFMILGGLVIIIFIFHSSITPAFSYSIFLRWGILLSLFGTVIPPLLFTRGMPLTGVGLGAIVASIELPVSVFTARLVLNEPVSVLQWIGVVLILSAVVLMNLKGEKMVSGGL